MTDIILTLVILIVLGIAGGYIYKEKKKGSHCIGCPHSGKCQKCSGK
ncbi:MAG: FeoB-associated Cys-rich membrane protein [Ruminococcaceae bacterium]|nr:FeoB-associated Cys-rich membrane protein [Oscillospiraceae bacterium]